jgi:hypothetical protein
MKNFRDLINESGAGLWGTDKARAKLQKDTPGQTIKSLVKDKEVTEAADPKGTIKVVKQDKVRYITKDELNTYRQMGWKQAEKRPQGDDKIRAAKKAHAAGTWDGNVNKDGKPIVHIDGKPVVVEETKKIKVSFKFNSVADSAKAERKAKQMKKLTVSSEKIEGKNLWLVHVAGDYAEVIKYLRRNDLGSNIRQTVKEGREIYIVKKGSYTRKVDGTTADRMKKDGWSIAGKETVSEGSESWEAGYKRRVVKTTKPEHKEKGYNWRIKGKDKAHLTIKLYKDKPSQAEFNKQMKRVAGHEFGG